MIHFLVAKLFFIFFSICHINATETVVAPSVLCANIGNARYLQLNHASNSKLAVFSFGQKWYAVWELEQPATDIVLPSQEEWPAGFISIKKISDIQTSRPCIIFSFEVSAEMMPFVIKTEKGWGINIVSDYLLKDNPNPNQISFDQEAGHFQILNANNTSFVVLNMPTGEELNVIPTGHPDTGLDPSHTHYVDIYESVQGACLYLKSDQFFIEKQTDDAAYYPTKEPLLRSQALLENISDLPPNITFIKTGDFTYEFRNFLAEKARQDTKNRSLHLLRKAWVELALGAGNEAAQTIFLLGKETPNFTNSLFYQIILGFSQFLSQNYKASIETLSSLPNTPEINLWRKLSQCQLDQRVVFSESTVSILKNYPQNLKDYIFSRLVPYLFESRQIKLLKTILQEITPQAESAKAIMSFYKAMHVFTFEDKDQGYKLLLPIAKNETPYPIPSDLQTEAKLETYFHENGEANEDELIKELDILRTQARGHDIEVKICLRLIKQLEKKKNYPRIIDLTQDLLLRFKKFDVSLGLHQLLRSYLEQYFVTTTENQSTVKTISLFAKYKPVIERYSVYEKIAESVAKKYEQLDLLDKAAELLTEIVKKTSNPEKKLELQIKIGNIYVKNSKPKETIKLLSGIYPSVGEEYQKQIEVIMSRAYCLEKDFDTAIQWLQRHPTKENKRAIADIYIITENYEHTVTSLNDYISSLAQNDDNERETALVQLAAAYHIQTNSEQLKTLFDDNKDFMQGRKNEKIFIMLCRPQAKDLKTFQEVYDYINDGNVIREIFEQQQ